MQLPAIIYVPRTITLPWDLGVGNYILMLQAAPVHRVTYIQ